MSARENEKKTCYCWRERSGQTDDNGRRYLLQKFRSISKNIQRDRVTFLSGKMNSLILSLE